MNTNPCQIQNHNQRNIISMCFSTSCQGKRQCCPICQTQLHNDHTNQLVDLDYLIEFIKAESNKPSVLQPEISQQLQELQQVLNYFEDIFKQIRGKMQKLSAMNLQQFCKDLGNKYYILKEDFQGLNNQDWNQLIDDMLTNFYVKDCAILQKNATNTLSKSMAIILNKFKEIKQELDPIEINKQYFQNFNGPQILQGHTNTVTGIDICKRRSLLASGSADKTVKLWSLVDNALINTYTYSGEVYDVIFSNEGNLLAFGGDGDFSIKLIDISDLQMKNEIISQLCGHKDYISRLVFSNYSKYLISGSEDKTVRVWDINTNKEAFLLNSERRVNGITISSDDILLAVNSNDGKIRIQDLKQNKLLCCQAAHDKGKGIQFSFDNKMLVSCDSAGVIKLWTLQELNLGRLTLIREFKAATNIIWTVLFSPCSKFIIFICNSAGQIKILDAQTGEVVKLFQTNQINAKSKRCLISSTVVDVAISKDLEIIAYGEDSKVAVWRNTQ